MPSFDVDVFLVLATSLHIAFGVEEELRQTKLISATYSESFRCIGPACEDTCCQGWTIPIDRAASDKFRILPSGPLRTLIDASVVLSTPRGSGSSKADTFARFRMTASNTCPLLSADNLCRIQTECGEAFLPHACATYPRILCGIGDIEEKALALSCPEAARLVLLNPALLNASYPEITEPRHRQKQNGDHVEGNRSLQPWFWSIREFSLGLVVNRAFPLWQRLFLLGVFCRGLDSLVRGDLKCSVSEFLRDFKATVASCAVPVTIETLDADVGQQLDVVLRLAGMLLHTSAVHPRFLDCIQAFTAGIGNRSGATLETLSSHYALAYQRYYEPFFERQPYILENYLINTIIRCQFPFGRDAMAAGTSSSMAREHALLTAQFALMKGFLIGVAGFHGEAFSTDHVVHTVQSVSKHFEHHSEFLDQAYALLVESQMDGDRGVAILLRNDVPVNRTEEEAPSFLWL